MSEDSAKYAISLEKTYRDKPIVDGKCIKIPSQAAQQVHKRSEGLSFNGIVVLEVVGYVLSGKHYRAIARCRCPFDSAEFLAYLTHVHSGMKKSCGCSTDRLHAESASRHGDALPKSKFHWLYRFWSGVQHRCYSTDPKYRLYVGRAPLEPFWSDYPAFKRQWLAVRGDACPMPGESLDRTDNNARYSLENLRFASRSQQAQNMSNTLYAVGPENLTVAIAKLYQESGSCVKYTTGLSRVRRGERKLEVAFESADLAGWEAVC